jgi:hypothetical protein
MRKFLQQSWFVLLAAALLLILIVLVTVKPSHAEGQRTTPSPTLTATDSRRAITTGIPSATNPVPLSSPTATETAPAPSLPVSLGDAVLFSNLGAKAGIDVQSLLLVKSVVSMAGPAGTSNETILGLLTVHVTNPDSEPRTYSLFSSAVILDGNWVDLWDFGRAGHYSLEIDGSRTNIDVQGDFELNPGSQATLQIWFVLPGNDFPRQTFAWMIACRSSLLEDPRFPGILRPLCEAGSESIYFLQDLTTVAAETPDPSSPTSLPFPQHWPAKAEDRLLPDDSDLPNCNDDAYASTAKALAASFNSQNRAVGINFAKNAGMPDMFLFSALTSGEIRKTTLKLSGQEYEIRLARVYYLTRAAGLHSIWLAYGYTDPAIWAERSGIPDLYNRGFQHFRGDATDWSPEAADAAMQIPGQTLSIYLSGWNVQADSVDLFECPSSWDGILQTDPAACALALRPEYLAGAGMTDQFIQMEVPPPGWFLFNWSFNLDGQTGLPAITPACR